MQKPNKARLHSLKTFNLRNYLQEKIEFNQIKRNSRYMTMITDKKKVCQILI